MGRVLILKGLPASGKSTFARKLLRGEIHDMRGNWKRINKDDLRAMLDDSYWSKGNEKFVLELRDKLIVEALDNMYDVVVDDTNLAPKHEDNIRKLVKDWNVFNNQKGRFYSVTVKNFEIEVNEAIKRDLKRSPSVGEKVIRQMHKQFIAQPPQTYVKPEGKPKTIMCDIDGTLAHMDGRTAFEWDKVHTDLLDEVVADVVKTYKAKGYTILIVSGRNEGCRQQTTEWLAKHGIEYEKMLMRADEDNRKDSITKLEIFDNHIRDNYAIEFVLDDRNQVVDMWRSIGLKVLQVNEGDF